jgi:hypothetical protein
MFLFKLSISVFNLASSFSSCLKLASSSVRTLSLVLVDKDHKGLKNNSQTTLIRFAVVYFVLLHLPYFLFQCFNLDSNINYTILIVFNVDFDLFAIGFRFQYGFLLSSTLSNVICQSDMSRVKIMRLACQNTSLLRMYNTDVQLCNVGVLRIHVRFFCILNRRFVRF